MSERGRDCGLKTLVGSVEVHSTVGSRVVQFGHQYSIFTVFGEVPFGQPFCLHLIFADKHPYFPWRGHQRHLLRLLSTSIYIDIKIVNLQLAPAFLTYNTTLRQLGVEYSTIHWLKEHCRIARQPDIPRWMEDVIELVPLDSTCLIKSELLGTSSLLHHSQSDSRVLQFWQSFQLVDRSNQCQN